jgi:RNA-directed DNA polymerase
LFGFVWWPTAARWEEPVSEPKPKDKPFAISKWKVWEAYQRAKANDGAAGVDGESIEEFERDLKGNLYKLWNRLSSGSYFPAPVRAVEIPKKHGQGKVRVLGVPTVADRIAQTVARLYLEPKVEPLFHPDSYGYRPGRSALQAVGVCRERCWRRNWVIDLDIRAFFDSVPHELVLRAVRRHTDERWILLYVERWLKAPLQQQDGTLARRERGTPQGSSISPLLANLFLHYAFDLWMRKEFPDLQFERYCDDVVVHCTTEKQAQFVRDAIAQRLADCGLELHPDKTRIVYCKDADRCATYSDERFDFLGYTFRPRLSRGKAGKFFVNFLPAVSDDARKTMSRELRSWRIDERSDKTLDDLAHMFNNVVQGWINYYGRFYKSMLYPILRRINEYLVRWARRKYKRLQRHDRRARRWLVRVAKRDPILFAHWKWGLRPDGWTMGAG